MVGVVVSCTGIIFVFLREIPCRAKLILGRQPGPPLLLPLSGPVIHTLSLV